jgi:hypothetical protein
MALGLHMRHPQASGHILTQFAPDGEEFIGQAFSFPNDPVKTGKNPKSACFSAAHFARYLGD